MADEGDEVCKNSSSNYLFVQSPFLDIKDKAYRMLLNKYGTHLTYSPTMLSTIITEEYLQECQQQRGYENTIFQVRAENVDSLIRAARILHEKGAFALDIITNEDSWENLLRNIREVTSKVQISVASKISVDLDDTSKAVTMVEDLHCAGCKVVLLHCHSATTASPIFLRKHWETIKKIRNSISVDTVLVEIQCSSVKDAKECIDFTGVQGIAVADPLLWNPAFFHSKRTSTVDMIKDYINICKDCHSQLTIVKENINKFSGYFLKRFPSVKESIEAAVTFDDIVAAIDSLNQEIALLSKKKLKGFEKLQQKKERHRINKLKRKRFKNETLADSQDNSICSPQEDFQSKRDIKEDRKQRVLAALKSGQRVAIDLSLEEHMSDKEITKVAGQVRRLYGSNLRASRPFHLYFTGLDENSKILQECRRQNNGFDNYLVDRRVEHVKELFDSASVVYLSPDSPNILQQLDERKVYVIGGLVDHQVLKGVSLTNASQSQIHTARLPLNEYMEAKCSGNHSYSRVLTINQVFDILLKFQETQDWNQALLVGVPKRKGFIPKTAQTTTKQTQ